FEPDAVFKEIKATHCFRYLEREEFNTLVHFLHQGGMALHQYKEYKKLEWEDGRFFIRDRGIAMRHRMQIGTIVSEAMLKVRMLGGGYVGMIEEYFIARLKPGDAFTLSGRVLELVSVKDMTVIARRSTSKKPIVPSWLGGRMPLSANLGYLLRKKLHEAADETPVKKR